MNPLDDPVELGRRIAACRGYASLPRTDFAALLGVSVYTVREWELGRALGGAVEERAELGRRIAAATGAPEFFLGLSDELDPSVRTASFADRLSALEAEVTEMRGKRAGNTVP